MPKGIRIIEEPFGPRIVALLDTEPNRAWSSVEICNKLGITGKQFNSSARNLLKKKKIFISSRGRYSTRQLRLETGDKLDIDVLREAVRELPDQFTIRDVEQRLARPLGNVGSMLDYMVKRDELCRTVLHGGVFSKTATGVPVLSVYDHVFSLLRREPNRVFSSGALRSLTGAPAATSEIGRLVQSGCAVKVAYGQYQLAPGISPLPPDTVLPGPITRVSIKKSTEAEKQRVVDYIRNNPGATRIQVFTALGLTEGQLATILTKHLFPVRLVVNIRDKLGPFDPERLYVNDQNDGATLYGSKGRYVGEGES